MTVIDQIRRWGINGQRVVEGPTELKGPLPRGGLSDLTRLSGIYGTVDRYEITNGSGTSAGDYTISLQPYSENGYAAIHRGVGDVAVFHQAGGIEEPTAPVVCLARQKPLAQARDVTLGPFTMEAGDRLWVVVEQRDYSTLRYQLQVSAEFNGGIIYCTPLYSELPVSYPPYECGTEVNTAGVTDFTDAWRDCSELTEFPCLDTSSGTNFNHAWAYTGLTTIPLLNTSNGETFNYSFYYARDLGGTFPLWDFSSAQELKYTWTVWDEECAPLQFASGCFESLTKNFAYFGYSFYGRQLTEESWDNIFSSLDASGTLCGTLRIWEETAPSFVQDANEGALFNLYAKGWTASTYDGYMYDLFPLTNYECSTEVDTAGVVNFTAAWNGCTELTEFPELDLSSGRVFDRTWAGCTGLTGFPDVDVSNGTNFTLAWSGCSDLSEFPVLDVSNGVTFDGTWQDCNSLASFPELDVSSGLIFSGAWNGCSSLTSFPALDLSSGTNFAAAWGNCTSLTSFPELDVSSGLHFVSAWQNCTPLTSFPELDVSSGTNFSSAWRACTSLTSFPEIDLSSGTNFSFAWSGCTSLTSFPELDVSSGADFNQAWYYCTSLASFPAGMFDTCTTTNFFYAWHNCALTEASVDNILVSVDTAGQSNGVLGIDGGTNAAPGVAGAAAKASLIAKGWTVLTN